MHWKHEINVLNVFKVDNKDTRTSVFIVNLFGTFYNVSVSIVDFEQANVCQMIVNFKHSQHINLTIHF